MTILYYDIFFLLFIWYLGIGMNFPGMIVHIFPLLALIAAVLRLTMPPPIVRIAVNPVRVGKTIRM